MLAADISSSSSFTVAPSAAMVLFTVLVLLACIALIVTAMKSQWGWLAAGLLTTGLVCLYSASLPAKPGSLWARRIASHRVR